LIYWYYKDDNKRVGPVSDEQIRELAREGRISPGTMVWNEIIGKWRPYSDAIGGPVGNPPATPPASGSTIYPGAAPDWESSSTSRQTHETGRGPDYSTTLSPEAYCNSCFNRFPVAEMRSTPNGPVCASCSGSSYTGIAGGTVSQSAIYAVEFTGSGKEYFKIWIVNLLLTILSVGLYSPWAKVRKNKYFYRNTRVAGSSFDYHGNPVSILRGRLLAVAILAALHFSQLHSVALYCFVLIVVALILPWMITRAFAFRLHNTSWRGIRMRFHGSVTSSYVVFFLYGALTIISAGICFPLLYQQIRLYFANNAAFGTTTGSMNVSAGEIYGVFIRTILISFLVAIVMIFLGGIFLNIIGSASVRAGQISKTTIMFIFVLIMAIYVLYRIIVQSFFRTRMTNLIWSHCILGNVTFESGQKARDLSSIVATNALLTFITLGFYWPWARTQLAKYHADTLIIHAPEGLNGFVADAGSVVAAAGEEVTEALDVDFSF
jgi:uncharacterized membrane protein YjgN (DUF898 family)